MNAWRYRLWAGLLVGSLAACGGEAPQQGPPPAAEVGVITLQAQPVTLSVQLAGRTKASLEAEVRPQISGIVLERNFTEGSMVQEGQQLYLIDPAPYIADLNRAQADLSKAAANVKTAKNRADRYETLVAARAVSQQDYDDALANYQQAQADVATARAAVTSAEINLDYTKVYAPITGLAGRSTVTVGALVTANQGDPLVTVQQFDPMFVDVTESSRALNRIRRQWASGELVRQDSAKVRLYFDDNDLYDQEGVFQFADINVDTGTGTFTIRTTFPNPDNVLLPGMFVRAEMVKGIVPNGLLVPARGVTRNAKGEATVMVVEDDKVAQRVVDAEQMVGQNWLIRSGLKAGDKVILEGLQFVRPGVPVGTVRELDQKQQG
ncbi:efflux transporter, RND family, MFP subunit [Ferrimonas balearica DSM 9799]|uniref:Efflux transporter, RND family, MFP subunit n=1 Tax=Ferrimonas balearica (strain DSM 9799 / CCM 4581 / KCTC 23876 / PAT) TaxID=550540 RepID=E1SS09_FERBD|nr:efflux RND transporter periplasmic adaptor subunit [Ferrimonas balearica]ADN75964.1 efflux transporter, RND family, MFP subunit [Ferrimonas balearica DSM 9799]MBW3138866.1 efflux RND transporter periplasmic adaptor subunit [Ferrimonas balearica]